MEAIAPIVGGFISGGAAGDAAEAQAGAAREASAVQEKARLQQRQDLMPWTTGGGLAQNELLRQLGLSGSPNGPTESREQIRNRLLSQYTTTGQGGIPQVGRFGVNADIAPQGVSGFYNGQQGYWVQNGEGSTFVQGGSGQSTVDEAGLEAAIAAELARNGAGPDDGKFGSLTKQFDSADLAKDLVYQNGLQFGLDNGNAAINQRAAASGGYGSGAALKALTKYGNDYATTKTAGAYDRNAADKARNYGMLQGVSAQGQSAAAGVGAAGINTANAQAGNINAAGNAAAAGSIAQGNAINGALGSLANNFQWNQLLNRSPAGNVNVGSGFSQTPDVLAYGGY